LNPAKIFPFGKGCGEIRVRHTGQHTPGPPAPDAAAASSNTSGSSSQKPETAAVPR
jgi:hypothetical protein